MLDRRRVLAGVTVLLLAVLAPRTARADCPADIDGSGNVGFPDLLSILSGWGPCVACPEDIDGNGDVGFSDLLVVLSTWGPCPGGPGACCLGPDACAVMTEQECSDAAGLGWVALGDCTDSDADRIPDAFERDDCVAAGGCFTGTDPFDRDTDGDGLDDGDEAYGTIQGLDLPALGADPLRPDIFIEADWMDESEGGLHSHRPTASAVAMVTAAFDAAPVVGPCGTTGIALHVDYGQGGPFTGGTVIGGDTVVVFDSEFNAYKTRNFSQRRKGYFHYSIHCHWYDFEGNTSSGVAELPGDDFIVSLYDLLGSYNIAHTIMHELGHNLTLRHGGSENRNFKPNYNSVMNYRYDFEGTDLTCDADGDFGLDYSHGVNIHLDENFLDEAAGVCGASFVDWNGNSIVDPPYAYNINCEQGAGAACGDDGGGACWDPACTPLFDFDDWAAVVLPIPVGTDFAERVTCGDARP